jgi:DNA polymerase-3 subunit gamma/tau
VSLYRRWRPRSFSDLVGQDAVVKTLTAALETGKLAHAYLFSGPRGSGKTSAAKILARCIDCVRGPTATPDNSCENCLAILAGTALDVLEIDAASNRGIDEIRALRDAVKFAPAAMRTKVYIIDEAHMLTKEGANAFLKTLEEPPPHAVFILATTEPDKLPVTILSRCQRYAFARIAIPIMIAKMREIAQAEGIAIDDDALTAIAYRADGGLRDALTMLEQASAFAATEPVTADMLDRAFGTSGREFAQAILDALVARDAAAALGAMEAAADAGTDMNVLGRALLAGFRHVLVASVAPQLLQRDLAPEDTAVAVERSRRLPQAAAVAALRLLADALALARGSGNPRLELESALLRYVLSGDGEERVPAPSAQPARSAQPAPATSTPRPPHAPSTQRPAQSKPAPKPPDGSPTLQKVRAAWQSVRAKAESESPPLRTPLSRARVAEVRGDVVVLVLHTPVEEEIVRERKGLLEAALADVLGVPMKIAPRVESASRAKPPFAAPASNEPAAGEDDADALFSYANERIRQP